MSGRLRLALLVLAPLVAYATAPANGFVWDDHKVIQKGRLIGSLRNVPALFSHDTMYNSDGGAFQAKAAIDTYRPLTMTTFFVEHALWGKRPVGYHVVSVLVHLGCVLLLFAVGVRLGASKDAAALGAMLFAVHPAIGEAVHWVNGRSDPLSVLFLLLALWAWLRGHGVATAACVLLATLCKETAFVLAPCALLLLPKREPKTGFVSAAWPWAAGALAGFAIRWLVLAHVAAAASGAHVGYALVRVPLLWLDGLRSLALPLAQTPDSLFERYRAAAPWRIALSTVAVAALAWAAARWFRKGHVLPAWALASLCAALGPVALLTADEGWTGWGRYLYPAAPAFCLAVAVAAIDLGLPRARDQMKRVVVWACVAAVVVCAGQTLALGRDYRDDRSFATALAADHPESSLGWSELSVVELNAEQPGRALAMAEKAIAIAPGRHEHWSRAAGALMQLGRREEAFRAAARAYELDPHDNNARYILAIGRLAAKDWENAARLLVEAVRAEPEQAGPRQTLEQALQHLGPDSPFARAVQRVNVSH
jgi:tetratricopeptide (TPR) repeat protein